MAVASERLCGRARVREVVHGKSCRYLKLQPTEIPRFLASRAFVVGLCDHGSGDLGFIINAKPGTATGKVSQLEEAQHMALFHRLAAYGRAHPFRISLGTATLKTAAADVLTQRYLEGSPSIDVRRLGLFTIFGFYYLGAFQYALYVRGFARWFPAATKFSEHATLAARMSDKAGLRDLVLQITAGNFVHIPFLFFPAFYLTQDATVHGWAASPARALDRYRRNAWTDLTSAWSIWIPGHAIFFSVPMWARLPTNHALSFGFVCVLSVMRGGETSG